MGGQAQVGTHTHNRKTHADLQRINKRPEIQIQEGRDKQTDTQQAVKQSTLINA